jgi:hypothetical protein
MSDFIRLVGYSYSYMETKNARRLSFSVSINRRVQMQRLESEAVQREAGDIPFTYAWMICLIK